MELFNFGSTGGGGAVNSVTASSPLFSSGGANPNITITQNFYDVGTGWPYATINAAIVAAVLAGDTSAIIRVNEDITEDVLLPRGMTLCGPVQVGSPTVSVTGNFQTAAPFIGNAYVKGLQIIGNGTAELLTANASTSIQFDNCIFAQGSDFNFLTATAGANVNLNNVLFIGTGIATANGMFVSGGNVNLYECSTLFISSNSFAVVDSGGLSIARTVIRGTITVTGGSVNATISQLAVGTGALLDIALFASATLSSCFLSSSAGTNCVTGSGTLYFNNITFNNTQKGIDSTIIMSPLTTAMNLIGNPDAGVAFGTSYEFGINKDGGVTPIGISFPSFSAFRVYGAGSQLFSFSEYQMRVTTNSSLGSSIPSLNWEVSSSVSLPSELNNIYFNLAPVGGQNFAAGIFQLQREFRIAAPTYTGTNPGSELVRAATHGIDGPPSAGSNMNIDLAIGSMVEARNVNLGSTGSVIGNCVFQSGISNGQGDTGVIAGYAVLSFSSVGLGNTTNSSSVVCSLYAPPIQYSAVTDTRTITSLATIYASSPSYSGTVSVTQGPYAGWFYNDGSDYGHVRIDGRLLKRQGTGLVAANDLTIGQDGTYFTVSGNTQINALSTAGFTSGSEIILKFLNDPTVKHGTAGGAGFAPLSLGGSVDLVAANDTILHLMYDGTVWQQVSVKQA